MDKSIEIKIPLIMDHPIGKVYISIIIRNTIFFILCLIFLPNIILYVGGDDQLKSYFPTSLEMIGTLAAFYFLAMYLIKRYFAGSIIKADNTLKHKHSKYSQKETTKYDLEAIRCILFEKLGSNNQYAIFFVEHSGKRHPIIEKFTVTFGAKEIMKFVSTLSDITGLPVREVGLSGTRVD